MEELLKEILRTLKDYGQILKHIDGRFDTMEMMIELVRQSQASITERENFLEGQCQEHHARSDKALQSLSRRISSIENQITPIPRPVVAVFKEEG